MLLCPSQRETSVIGDVLVDRLGDVGGQRDVAELPGGPELQRAELGDRVDLLPDPQGRALVDAAAGPDGERLADPQPAAVHEPDAGAPVRRQPGGQHLQLAGIGQDEVRCPDDDGTGMSVQGDSASFLLRTVSLNTALMTRCAWLTRLADRPCGSSWR